MSEDLIENGEVAVEPLEDSVIDDVEVRSREDGLTQKGKERFFSEMEREESRSTSSTKSVLCHTLSIC